MYPIDVTRVFLKRMNVALDEVKLIAENWSKF